MPAEGVFINCPFDPAYARLHRALWFVTLAFGYRPRSALEVDNGAQNRLEKIVGLIRACRLGVHDLSRTELDAGTGLPHFNMPFELGLFLGARAFGGPAQRRKSCLVFVRQPYDHQKLISDLAGQDTHAHQGRLDELVGKTRNWLRMDLPQVPFVPEVPGDRALVQWFEEFEDERARYYAALGVSNPTFVEDLEVMTEWLIDAQGYTPLDEA